MDKEQLWDTLVAFSGKSFQTVKGLEFRYTIRGNEMFIDRKKKTITRSSIDLAFETAQQMKGQVRGPKQLGVFGASYLYPVFQKIGIIKI